MMAKQLGKDYYFYQQQKIGAGSFANVYKGFSRKHNKIVAIKHITNSSSIFQAQQASEEKRKQLQSEVEIMASIKHKNVLQFYDFVTIGKESYIITQYCHSGTLQSILEKAIHNQSQQGAPPLSQLYVFDIFCQIIDGMCEIHKKEIIHRDLSLKNIMLTNEGVVKIIDFGVSRKSAGSNIFAPSKIYTKDKGTPMFMSPNQLNGNQYSAKCDVWSAGVITYCMLTGKHPFRSAFTKTLQQAIDQMKVRPIVVPQQFHQFFRDVIPWMVCYDQNKRGTFFEIQKYLTPAKRAEICNQLNKMSIDKTIEIQAPLVAQNGFTDTMEEKLNQLKFVQTQSKMFQYLRFIDQRARLFIIVSDRMMGIPNFPLHPVKVLLLSFLMHCIYLGYRNQLFKLLRSDIIHNGFPLPEGKVLNFTEFLPRFEQTLRSNIGPALETAQSGMRMIADKCKLIVNNFRQSLQTYAQRQMFTARHQNALKMMDFLVNQTKVQSRAYNENYYNSFLESDCFLSNVTLVTQASQQAIRTYSLLFALKNINQFVPIRQFENSDLVNKLVENFERNLQVQTLLLSLNE